MDFNETAKAIGFRDGDILISADGVPFERYGLVLLYTVILTQVRRVQVQRYLLMYYTPKTLLNHVFEDLRKTKAPNSSPSQY